MRARSRWILWGCALLCAFCLGASGLFTLAQEETTWEEEGRLIGVLVTTQPLDLFDLEASGGPAGGRPHRRAVRLPV